MLANSKQVAALVNAFQRGTRLTYSKGEYIIRPGETPPGVFYIEKGVVKAFNISKYGEENLLIIRNKDEIFPLIWALTEQEHDIIYQALATTSVWRISQDDFTNYLHSHPEALPPLLDMTVEMYRRHSERILNLQYRSVRERLISFLITMSERFGAKKPGGLYINVPLRQQDIASSINSSRETTSRELSYLERKDLIKVEPPFIVILDHKNLRTYL